MGVGSGSPYDTKPKLRNGSPKVCEMDPALGRSRTRKLQRVESCGAYHWLCLVTGCTLVVVAAHTDHHTPTQTQSKFGHSKKIKIDISRKLRRIERNGLGDDVIPSRATGSTQNIPYDPEPKLRNATSWMFFFAKLYNGGVLRPKTRKTTWPSNEQLLEKVPRKCLERCKRWASAPPVLTNHSQCPEVHFLTTFQLFPKSIHPKSKSFSSFRDNRLLRHFSKTQKLISRGSVQCSRCRVTAAGKGIQRALQRCLP